SVDTHHTARRPLLILFNDPAPTEIYTLSLHDALPILGYGVTGNQGIGNYISLVTLGTGGVYPQEGVFYQTYGAARNPNPDLKWRSEEHTSELQSRENLVCRLLLEKNKKNDRQTPDDET